MSCQDSAVGPDILPSTTIVENGTVHSRSIEDGAMTTSAPQISSAQEVAGLPEAPANACSGAADAESSIAGEHSKTNADAGYCDAENSGAIKSCTRPRRKKGSTSFKRRKKKRSSGNGSGVAAVIGNYWEVEAIEAFRKKGKLQKKTGAAPVFEFLVKWKGFEERTWEPEENLCDTALLDARKIISEQAEHQLGLEVALSKENLAPELDEEIFDLDPDEAEVPSVKIPSPAKKTTELRDPTDGFEDTNWDWSDQGQIKFREIERISVHDPDARRKVAEYNQNGVPMVITGHVGWAQFAKLWLVEADGDTSIRDENRKPIEHERKDLSSVAEPMPFKVEAVQGNAKEGELAQSNAMGGESALLNASEGEASQPNAMGVQPAHLNATEGEAVPLNAAEAEAAQLNAMDGETVPLNATEAEAAQLNVMDGDTLPLNATEAEAAQLNAMDVETLPLDVTEGEAKEDKMMQLNATEAEVVQPSVAESGAAQLNAKEGETAQLNLMDVEAVQVNAMEGEATDGEAARLMATEGQPAHVNVAEGEASRLNGVEGEVVRLKATEGDAGQLNSSRSELGSAENDMKPIEEEDGLKQHVIANENTIVTDDNCWKTEAAKSFEIKETLMKTSPSDCADLLDLSKPHYVNIEKMIDAIGKEAVPVIRKNYNERNPIQAQLTVETFLKKCWPTRDEIDQKVPMRKLPWLYLHQWQFPLSDTAVPKMCGAGKNNPLPNHILGDDLLCYWLDKDKCNQDSPFQYLFMGREGTKSNLHRDNGNLMITIAPIVGMKEVILIHRADGPSCLYHLDASIDQPDLHRFPLMYDVRAWKSVLKPGEILIMPYGTYHQCRNVSPCLSYHRFYLDTLNLKAFLESYFDQDAPEIQHDEIIWNASHELSDRVASFVEEVERTQNPNVPKEISAAIDALRVLRNISRELAMREEAKARQRGRKSTTDEMHEWGPMVDDIDAILHLFRYRLRKRRPPFFRRKSRHESHKENANDSKKRQRPRASNGSLSESRDNLQAPDNNDDQHPARTILEGAFRKLPRVDRNESGIVVSDSLILKTGDKVIVRLHGKRALGTIENIQDTVKAAYLSYDEFPLCHEEYQPVDRLRTRVAGGETSAAISSDALHEGMHVFHVEQGGEEYRAVVKSWKQATFYLVNLELRNGSDFVYKQWVTRDSIIDVVDPVGSPRKLSSDRLERTPIPLESPNGSTSHAPFHPSEVGSSEPACERFPHESAWSSEPGLMTDALHIATSSLQVNGADNSKELTLESDEI